MIDVNLYIVILYSVFYTSLVHYLRCLYCARSDIMFDILG